MSSRPPKPTAMTGEGAAIERMLADARIYGFGNFQAALGWAWSQELQKDGLSKTTADEAASNRTPYDSPWWRNP